MRGMPIHVNFALKTKEKSRLVSNVLLVKDNDVVCGYIFQ